MKRTLKVIGIGLVAVLLLTFVLAGTVFADTPGNGDNTEAYCGFGGHGFWGDDEHGSDTVADLLGLSQDEIQALRLEGQSLVEIAAAQGVSEADLVAAIMADKTEALQARVAEGTVTQEQADLMLQQMEQRTIQAVNRTTTGPAEWRGSGNGAGYGQCGEGAGPGMMNRWSTGGRAARFGDGTGQTGTFRMGGWR